MVSDVSPAKKLSAQDVLPRYTGGPGSNRDPRAHAEALRAAVELVAELGYAKVSMEAIAKRAGVGKPTLYRWWPNKASLCLLYTSPSPRDS